ncbi:MAG TPA: tRNA (adenosine(37)-N6)-dimethylallyltransferase MiaA [Candidatus Angelobacter sp.]|nr:tRNA (adenosine(37)-N6)-dimethylallyltransferase MiaA [Candidatus Angelobacter sp.]
MVKNNKPLIVIVGPTASGKTTLAVEIAEQFGGEIICADSRTVYKGMDIGTAKPTSKDRERVPHWGLDLVNPGDYFSVADFKEYAQKKIEEIRTRGNFPFLVGGTGLYIDSILFDYKFGEKADISRRNLLNTMTLDQLHDYCNKNNILLPENKRNKRYVVRTIERSGTINTKKSNPIDNSIIVGITTEKTVLRTRIESRIEQLFDNGVVDEAKKLGEKYGWNNEALKGNVYPLAHSYLLGDMTLGDMKIKLATIDWRLAKRQLTWLKHNPFIKWMSIDQAKICLSDQLANCD